jgi:hypothetical protein
VSILHRLPGLLMLAGLLAVGGSLHMRDRLPGPAGLLSEIQAEPIQEAEQRQPFRHRVGEVEYTVKPLFRYQLSGLVVSRHDAGAWWDIVHRKDWRDHLNVVDLCVIWGRNARTGAYQGLRFWSEVFTCNAATDSGEAWERFDPNALSNNHLLASDPRLVRLLRSVRPGDQVRVEGYLAEYSHQHGRSFRRGTSTVRTDRGDGACETIWVTEAQVLRAANRGWRLLMPIGLGTIALSVLLWWFVPLPRLSD